MPLGEGGDSLNGQVPRPDGEATERRGRWLGSVSGVSPAGCALVRVTQSARRFWGRTMINLATVVGRATAVGSSEPCRSWYSGIPFTALPRHSGASSLFGFAGHNKLVNRTHCGRAHRATNSLFARCALPQRSGYRHRYAALRRTCARAPLRRTKISTVEEDL